jgi:UDP-N-acetylglucosamine diphosphorylase/glucosamine-1-phosphate N-acetyltransferase
MSKLAIFEDKAANNFLPLTWTRPVWDLRCGIWTLREAIEDAYSYRADALFVRDLLADVVRERTGLPVNEGLGAEMYLLLNGRLLASREMPRTLPMYGEPCRYVAPNGTLLAAWLPGHLLNEGWDAINSLPLKEVEWPLIEWPWELFHKNGARITSQAERWELGYHPTIIPEWVHLLHPERIYVDSTARIMPGVVLDAIDGPIVIEKNVAVMANSVIQGPAYIGPNSKIKIGAKLYHNTTIGPVCKVGGEIEESIIHGYSNKQHDGFLGHAYVGEWCNFGADTNNSDLKNNYSTVKVWSDGAWQDTGSLFVGLIMGDHSKTGINSMLNTGTIAGVSCNIFDGSLPPRYLPSFSWGSAAGLTDYRLDKALETAGRVMARRQKLLSQAERALLTHIFHATAGERAQKT